MKDIALSLKLTYVWYDVYEVVFMKIMASIILDLLQHICFQGQIVCTKKFNQFNQLFIYEI